MYFNNSRWQNDQNRRRCNSSSESLNSTEDNGALAEVVPRVQEAIIYKYILFPTIKCVHWVDKLLLKLQLSKIHNTISINKIIFKKINFIVDCDLLFLHICSTSLSIQKQNIEQQRDILNQSQGLSNILSNSLKNKRRPSIWIKKLDSTKRQSNHSQFHQSSPVSTTEDQHKGFKGKFYGPFVCKKLNQTLNELFTLLYTRSVALHKH